MASARPAADPVSRRRFFAVSGGTGAAALLVACGDDEDSATETTTRRQPGYIGETERRPDGPPTVPGEFAYSTDLSAAVRDRLGRRLATTCAISAIDPASTAT